MNHEHEIYLCMGCGSTMTAEECTADGCNLKCSNCGMVVSAWCDCCGRRYPLRSDHGDDGYSLCPDCFRRSYFICDGCGVLVHNDNGYFIIH